MTDLEVKPGTYTLDPDRHPLVTVPDLSGVILDWDARDLDLGAFTAWEDRVEGVSLTQYSTTGSLSVVTEGGKRGVRFAEPVSINASRTLGRDVTKVVVLRAESGFGVNSRVVTSVSSNAFRAIRSVNSYWRAAASNQASSPSYGDAPGALGAVQVHGAAWGDGIVRVKRHGGTLVEASQESPDSEPGLLVGSDSSTEPVESSTFSGVIHKILIFDRALDAISLDVLLAQLHAEWD